MAIRLIAAFLLIALPWYAFVAREHPGLVAYWFGTELRDRVLFGASNRNGEWYGWLAVYVPTLLLGTLPWTSALFRSAAAALPRDRITRKIICRFYEMHAGCDLNSGETAGKAARFYLPLRLYPIRQ